MFKTIMTSVCAIAICLRCIELWHMTIMAVCIGLIFSLFMCGIIEWEREQERKYKAKSRVNAVKKEWVHIGNKIAAE